MNIDIQIAQLVSNIANMKDKLEELKKEKESIDTLFDNKNIFHINYGDFARNQSSLFNSRHYCDCNSKNCFFNKNFINYKNTKYHDKHKCFLYFTNSKIKNKKYYYDIMKSDYNHTLGYLESNQYFLSSLFLTQYTLVKDKNNILRKVFLFEKNNLNVIRKTPIFNFILINSGTSLYYLLYAKNEFKINDDFITNKIINGNIEEEGLSVVNFTYKFESNFNNNVENVADFQKELKESILEFIGFKYFSDMKKEFFNKENLPFNLDFHLMTK
jgi:hypothetical protein